MDHRTSRVGDARTLRQTAQAAATFALLRSAYAIGPRAARRVAHPLERSTALVLCALLVAAILGTLITAGTSVAQRLQTPDARVVAARSDEADATGAACIAPRQLARR